MLYFIKTLGDMYEKYKIKVFIHGNSTDYVVVHMANQFNIDGRDYKISQFNK